MLFIQDLLDQFVVDFVLDLFDQLHIGQGQENRGLFSLPPNDDPLSPGCPVQQVGQFRIRLFNRQFSYDHLPKVFGSLLIVSYKNRRVNHLSEQGLP